MSVTKILHHPHLLANVLKYIINDYMGIIQTCKIPNICKSEYLAQCYNDLHDDPRHECTDNKCCSRYDLRCKLRRTNDDPTKLFTWEWSDISTDSKYSKLMLYAARNGADFIESSYFVLYLFTEPGKYISEIFRILMSKGHSYLYRFTKKWKRDLEHSFPRRVEIPFFKERMLILYGESPRNPLIHRWKGFSKFILENCLDFIPKEQIEPFVSPDGKHLLTITTKITHKFTCSWELHDMNDPDKKPVNLNRVFRYMTPWETHVEWINGNGIKFTSLVSGDLWVYSVDSGNWTRE